MTLKETSNPVVLVLGNGRQQFLCHLKVISEDGSLVFNDTERKGETVDGKVLVAEVNTVVTGNVAEQVDVLVKVGDGRNLTTDDVVEAVERTGVDEAVSDPGSGLDTEYQNQ